MMQNGLELMAIGMTAVFAFLAILVTILSLMGAYFRRFPEPVATGATSAGRASAAGAPGSRLPGSSVIAAAAAAAFDTNKQTESGDETR
jgi:sodium pump decarboxylase gamma subunit